MVLVGVHSSVFATNIPATAYDCQGQRFTVHYNTGAIGKPSLVIGRVGDPIVKRNNETSIQRTVLGSLATILVRQEPDNFTETFTFVAPDVNVPSENPVVEFTTELFRTRAHTTIGGPGLVQGVIQESISEQVFCKATTPIL
jgi:hypothetical protein